MILCFVRAQTRHSLKMFSVPVYLANRAPPRNCECVFSVVDPFRCCVYVGIECVNRTTDSEYIIIIMSTADLYDSDMDNYTHVNQYNENI